MSIESRVANGVQFLDRFEGVEWIENIDLDRLNLSDDYDCIVGQLYGSYHDGLDDLEISNAEAAELGFLCKAGVTIGRYVQYHDRDLSDAEFVELTKVWTEVILELRG